jgi:thioredoxin 1
VNDSVREASTQNWDTEVLAAEQPVLVDFWAPWCAPCRALGPVVDQVAQSFEGRVKVVKLNVDDHRALAERYDVRAIPTLVLFREGQIAERRVGALPKGDLVQLLESQLTHAEIPGRSQNP